MRAPTFASLTAAVAIAVVAGATVLAALAADHAFAGTTG